MRVRLARLGDAEAAAKAFRSVAEERVYIAHRPPVDVALAAEEVRAWARSADDQFWILEDEGRVLGNLGIHAAGRPPGVAGLGMLVVAPARGRGGGRMLLDTAIAWARAADLHKVDLEVYLDNARAIALGLRGRGRAARPLPSARRAPALQPADGAVRVRSER